MALPVAVQLYSVRDSVEADMASALRKIKDMGYDGVEFAGLYGHSADYIRGLLDAIGLVPISAHVPLVEMLADPDGTFETYKKIGCRFVAVPYVTEERRPGAEKFDETVEDITRIGAYAHKIGLTLLYHNHDFEFGYRNYQEFHLVPQSAAMELYVCLLQQSLLLLCFYQSFRLLHLKTI